MTPDEVVVAEHLRISLINDVTLFVPVSLAYGTFLYLFCHSTSIFMRRGLRSWPTRVMFITSLTTVIFAGIQWAILLASFIVHIKASFPEDLSRFGDPSRLAAMNVRLFPLQVTINLVDQLAIYISDAVVIWRAWVLFPEEWWMMVIPVALLVASIASGLAYVALMSSVATFVAVSNREPVPAMKLVTANMALSLATNVAATVLIAYKLWSHRKIVGVNKHGSLSAVQKILVMLIESGIIYCGVQLARLILYCSPGTLLSTRYFVSEVAVDLATVATGIYPTLVIMFVNQQRTIVECFGFGPSLADKKLPTEDVEGRVATPGHLSFTSPSSVGATHIGSLRPQKPDLSSTEGGADFFPFEKRSLVESEFVSGQTKSSPF
ncbi:hypothetical protein FPV67DRAFT_1503500 [Lyophyllum atratum]|nr:hypothetical protein FPV67DRAFT_1503500 [Lyophyllum atratum]